MLIVFTQEGIYMKKFMLVAGLLCFGAIQTSDSKSGAGKAAAAGGAGSAARGGAGASASEAKPGMVASLMAALSLGGGAAKEVPSLEARVAALPKLIVGKDRERCFPDRMVVRPASVKADVSELATTGVCYDLIGAALVAAGRRAILYKASDDEVRSMIRAVNQFHVDTYKPAELATIPVALASLHGRSSARLMNDNVIVRL